MLRFFDVNAGVGRWKHPVYGGYETAEELESILDYLDMDGAVVYHAYAQESQAPMGNQVLLAELAGHDRLAPSWVLFPHFTGEMPEPAELVETMLEHRVHVARMLPGINGHRFSLEPWCADPVLKELGRHRLPLVMDFRLSRRDAPDYRAIYDLCQRHPRLPVILTGGLIRDTRSVYPLCLASPNLYLETSGFNAFRGMEHFCRNIGARRLLYGSGLPWRAPGAAITAVTHAFISDEEKALVAGENLVRLLDEVVT